MHLTNLARRSFLLFDKEKTKTMKKKFAGERGLILSHQQEEDKKIPSYFKVRNLRETKCGKITKVWNR